jgi:hypothetical protein
MMRRTPTRLDMYTLLLAIDALESSLHSSLSRVIEIRRYLEGWNDGGSHPAELERVTAAAAHVAKATTLLRQFPIIRP